MGASNSKGPYGYGGYGGYGPSGRGGSSGGFAGTTNNTGVPGQGMFNEMYGLNAVSSSGENYSAPF
jgi:hypothetical protein